MNTFKLEKLKTVPKTLACSLLVAGLLSTPGASFSASIGEIITTTPSASVYVFVTDGIATLSGSVPAESTLDQLIDAALEMSNVTSVNSELIVSEQLLIDDTSPDILGSEFLPTGEPSIDYAEE